MAEIECTVHVDMSIGPQTSWVETSSAKQATGATSQDITVLKHI
jgi:hypothetical protein